MIAAVSVGILLLAAGVTTAVVVLTRDSSSATERVRPAATSSTTAAPPDPTLITTPPPTRPLVPPEVQGTVNLAQRWASALAAHDWTTARSIEPAIGATSDDTLQSGFGGLKDDAVVFVATRDAGAVMVASVAHENVGAGPRTNVFCFLITPDPSGATLQAQLQRRVTTTSIPSWVAPETLMAEISQCQTA